METVPIMDRTDEQWQAEFDKVNAAVEQQNSGGIAASSIKSLTPADVAGYIDHTLLKLDATGEQVDKLCDEAKQWKFAVRTLECSKDVGTNFIRPHSCYSVPTLSDFV